MFTIIRELGPYFFSDLLFRGAPIARMLAKEVR
jgi:hypothetical protein